jgi:hypothetical protein
MRNSLMRGFAFVANKGQTQHADIAKSKLLFHAAVGTNNVGALSGELFNAVFGEHGEFI